MCKTSGTQHNFYRVVIHVGLYVIVTLENGRARRPRSVFRKRNHIETGGICI